MPTRSWEHATPSRNFRSKAARCRRITADAISVISSTIGPIFSEAIGPSAFAYHDRQMYGLETFPELSRLVAQDYRLVYDSDSLRLFQRKGSPRA